jgi:DNA mismatch endonuclease (patch repair protein)
MVPDEPLLPQRSGNRPPIPAPSSPAAGSRMRQQRQRDTRPELRLRSELYKRGLRFFVHRKPLPKVRRIADVVFPRARVVVEVRGCFWHSCPLHATVPKANTDWWQAKLTANRQRDLETEELLRAAGWVPIVVWEHDDPAAAATRIELVVRQRLKEGVT